MLLDADQCYAGLCARDPRFDGLFFVGVITTGVYCRPICRVRTPLRENCRFFGRAASAEAAGFRPCLRCRPELAPGEAATEAVERHAAIALRRIQSGVHAAGGLESLAAELGLSDRQLRRCVRRAFGVSPQALLQTQRLLLAKQLLTDTALPITEIAFASGFSSLRRFNAAFRDHYRLRPSQLRKQEPPRGAEGGLRLRLSYRPPLAWRHLVEFLVARGAPSVERREDDRYMRTIRLGAQHGWIAAQPLGAGSLELEVSLSLVPVLSQLLPALRQLFDLDAHPGRIADQLAADPRLRRRVRAMPGLRVPGALDGFDLALRAVLGQQISVRAASTLYTRVVGQFGAPVQTPYAGLNRLPPTAADLVAVPMAALCALGVTRTRAATIVELARACTDGDLRLQAGADPASVREALRAIPGIGPWTIEYVAMRVLADPDAFPESDLALLKASGCSRPQQLRALGEAWRPWRAYAAMYLWSPSDGAEHADPALSPL